ncbi:alcohol dehydrogenase catalytic domain-containing protein, partial [Curtobacterium sp. B18]|uniref:alcohol dehydrogenase catalytic domain-containing protein n=1 Tax=Curtobacterium sp. B18 TaxID=95614 RepID=UPI0004CFA8AA
VYREFQAGQPGAQQPPFVLGHENSGWVEELGDGVSGFTAGDAYLVYGPVGCGHCSYCSKGQDTYCDNAATNPYAGIGLGRDGGMAEYVTVPARNLVPLGDADPVGPAARRLAGAPAPCRPGRHRRGRRRRPDERGRRDRAQGPLRGVGAS